MAQSHMKEWQNEQPGEDAVDSENDPQNGKRLHMASDARIRPRNHARIAGRRCAWNGRRSRSCRDIRCTTLRASRLTSNGCPTLTAIHIRPLSLLGSCPVPLKIRRCRQIGSRFLPAIPRAQLTGRKCIGPLRFAGFGRKEIQAGFGENRSHLRGPSWHPSSEKTTDSSINGFFLLTLVRQSREYPPGWMCDASHLPYETRWYTSWFLQKHRIYQAKRLQQDQVRPSYRRIS